MRGGAQDRFITALLCSDRSPEELMEFFSSVANELQCQSSQAADVSASFASLGIVP